jgi:hypothetical protein
VNDFVSETPQRAFRALFGRARLLLALAGIASTASHCASSEAAPPAPGDGSAAGAGGAGDTVSDSGEYGACTDLPPADPTPELTGRWALRTIASRYVPANGLTAAFYTRTVSVLLADLTQTGTDVTLAAQYCEQHAEDPDAAAHVVVPERYVSSLAPFVRTGTYAEGDAGVPILELPSFVELIGASLSDPAADALPQEASDPSVIDQDEDGLPGVTIKLSGLASGDLYVVQRLTSELTGLAVGSDRVAGHYGFTSEQNILDSDPAVLKALAAQTAITDPHVCASTFLMVRVEPTVTCDDARANPALFD